MFVNCCVAVRVATSKTRNRRENLLSLQASGNFFISKTVKQILQPTEFENEHWYASYGMHRDTEATNKRVHSIIFSKQTTFIQHAEIGSI